MTHVDQDYPRAMYRNGAYTSVASETEEKVARKDGWRSYYEDQRRMGTPKDGAEAKKAAPAPQAIPDTYSAPDYSARKRA